MEKFVCPICGKKVFSKAYIEKHKRTCQPLPDKLPDFEKVNEFKCSIESGGSNYDISLKREKRFFSKVFPEKRFRSEKKGDFETERTGLYINNDLFIVQESTGECRKFISDWFDMQEEDRVWSFEPKNQQVCYDSDANEVIFKRQACKKGQIKLDYQLGFKLDHSNATAYPFTQSSSYILIEDFPMMPSCSKEPLPDIPDALKIEFGRGSGSAEEKSHASGYWALFFLRFSQKQGSEIFKPVFLDYKLRDSHMGNTGCNTKHEDLKACKSIKSGFLVKSLINGVNPVLRNNVPEDNFGKPVFKKGLSPWNVFMDLSSSLSGYVYNTTVYSDESIHIRIDCSNMTGLFKEDRYCDTST